MRSFLAVTLPVRRAAPFVFGSLTVAACSLTEEVRTRPGAPGDIPFTQDDGSPGTGGAAGRDAGRDAAADAIGGGGAGSGGRGGKGGTGGRHTGGSVGAGGGAIRDAAPDAPRACPVDITPACHDYCGALSVPPECRSMLRTAAGVKPDGGFDFPDGDVPHDPPISELVERCECSCELHYRTDACSLLFNQLIVCAPTPLAVVCPTDQVVEFPSVIGPCGGARGAFLSCLDSGANATDGGP